MSNFDCLSCEHGEKCTLYMATGITRCKDYKKKKPEIKDSGERTVFPTGSVRDMHEGKGDMVSIPWESILRLSKHYENGAKKYQRWNFRKGIPVSSFVLGAMLMENTMPEMNDLPLRKGKKTFNYFE